MLIRLGVLLGCDYTKHRVGFSRAHDLVLEHKDHSKAIAHLRATNPNIPGSYEQIYKKAVMTFKHHVVYDPELETATYVHEPEPNSEANLFVHIGSGFQLRVINDMMLKSHHCLLEALFIRTGGRNSYMKALKRGNRVEAEDTKSEPSIVLGDECVNDNNLSNALLGRVKEFASLANLKLALGNEGFRDITIKYLGELWVLLEFKSEESKNKFKDNVSVASWFSQIIEASTYFVVEGRIAWVELLDVDDQEETCFHSKRLCIHMKSGKSINEEFKILYRGKTYWIRANETPGWVPDFNEEADDEDETNSMKREGDGQKFSVVWMKTATMRRVQKCEDLKTGNKEEVNDAYSDCQDYNNSKGNGNESFCSGHFKKSELPRTGGSIIGVLEEVVKVGQVMGYKMKGCISNLGKIIGSRGGL
nr:nucleotide-binding alpha-beta plait domain-containing protein [Tanacetum cinerariifolium]